jgi:hypothetical protein
MGLCTEARLPAPESQSKVIAPLEVSLSCTCCFWADISGDTANEAARPPGGFGGGEATVKVGAHVAVGLGESEPVGGRSAA